MPSFDMRPIDFHIHIIQNIIHEDNIVQFCSRCNTKKRLGWVGAFGIPATKMFRLVFA